MEAPKRRKVLRRLFWTSVGAIVIALASLPLWFPWVLKPLLKSQGANFGAYDRIGFSRFAVDNFTYQDAHVLLKAQRVEGSLPLSWLWRIGVSQKVSAPLLRMSTGELVILPSDSTNQSGSGSLDKTIHEVVQTAKLLEQWVPVAELTNGTIRITSNLTVLVPQADWRAGRLRGNVGIPKWRTEIAVGGVLNQDSSVQFSAKSDAYQAGFDGQLSPSPSGWKLTGQANWRTNQAGITAQFPTNGWWPAQARFECRQLNVPPAMLGLEGFDEAPANLVLTLTSNRFHLQATGTMRPASNYVSAGFPAGTFSLEAEGDPESMNVRELKFASPWLDAQLTNSVSITWKGQLGASPAQFRLMADLSQVPGEALAGKIDGAVSIEQGEPESPLARFALSAENLRVRRADLKAVSVLGEFNSPRLNLHEFKVELPDGSTAAVNGSVDVARREVLVGEWTVAGGFLKKLLPELDYNDLKGSGKLAGAFTNLVHHGKFSLHGFKTGRLRAVDADVAWTGRAERLDTVDAKLGARESVLAIHGAADLGLRKGAATVATVTNVSFRRKETELYALQKPSTIRFRAGTNEAVKEWNLAVDGFDWQGPHHKIFLTTDLTWPVRGQAEAQMTNVALRDFSDFLGDGIFNVSLTEIGLAAQWSNGPVRGMLTATSTLTNQGGQAFTFRGELSADEQLSIRRLSVETRYSPTVLLSGSVPIKFIPARTGHELVWNEAGAVRLTGSWDDRESTNLALQLGRAGKLEVARPQFDFQVSGTPDAPSASLNLAAGRISWQLPDQRLLLPALADFQLKAEVHPNEIRLATFEGHMDAQRIHATGEWPLPAGAWHGLWSKGAFPDWKEARGELQLESAKLAALSRYLPPVLTPEGILDARLELKVGKKVDGVLALTNASTRSLGPLSPLRDITALVRFDQNHATLEEFRGQIGGQSVRGDGGIAWAGDGGQDYTFNLSGTNVPLVRSLEFLLRGDVDLHVRSKGKESPTVVSGTVNLHDGLYVQHASALVWSGPRRPELHPPYFSVTNQPVADWKLDLAVKGDRFLRARTPLFSGLLSATLNLGGSFRQPMLTGDVGMKSGRIVLPFGSLNIDSGYASFSGNDPQGPNLQINASGRNYRYDIRLTVKGPADIADVTFSSTPPLTSEQILLMLTAGEVPQTDYTFTTTEKAGRLATFVGKDLWSRFMGSGRAEERLIIRTGEGISEEGRLTYSVEYRLTDRWSLLGEYDEFNDFNADLKWKVFSR